MQKLEIKNIINSNEKINKIVNSSKHILHAVLIVGTDSLYANEFCKTLICKILESNNRSDLVQKVENNSLIDLTTISGEESIKVADISSVIEKSYEKGIESDQKFCIIQNAQRLTIEAQNKLLKTLEEPTQDQYFFLCVPSMYLLLPTIVSRCTTIELPCLEKTEVNKYLSANNITSSSNLAELSLGTIKDICENEKLYQDNFDLAFESLIKIKSSANVVSFSIKIQKANIELILKYLEQLICDSLKLKNSISNIWFESKTNELKSLDCSQKGLIFIYNEIQKLKQNIKYNVSPTVMADKLTLSIAEGKHKND